MKSKPIIYGYARISTMKQRIERQVDNIREKYPDAVIITESYTGTKIDRPAFSKLLQQVKAETDKGRDITIVFDEVSRMSRNAAEGFSLYRELYEMGVNLVFLKEPHINTDVYKSTAQAPLTGTKDLDETLIKGLNEYLMRLAEKQIQIAFDTAQAEVDFLHKRTSEGVRKAQAAGKRIGRAGGALEGVDFKESAKATAAKELIRKHARNFGGALTDAQALKLAGCSRNTYYKYKMQIKREMDA